MRPPPPEDKFRSNHSLFRKNSDFLSLQQRNRGTFYFESFHDSMHKMRLRNNLSSIRLEVVRVRQQLFQKLKLIEIRVNYKNMFHI